MLDPVTLDERLDAVRGDRPRVLVVGAGAAGVTLAQFLRAAGLDPVLVERRGAAAGSGYKLGLMPLVDPPMAHLEVQDAYRERSVPVRRYAMLDRSGRPLRQSRHSPAGCGPRADRALRFLGQGTGAHPRAAVERPWAPARACGSRPGVTSAGATGVRRTVTAG